MARRQMNGLFLMTPFSLLKLPAYGRFFDGATIGHLYRLILTGVRRQGTSQLRFKNDTGWVTKLAKLYDEGHLASYFTMETLESSTEYTPKQISNLIKKLEELKLVKTEKFGEGLIFIVGARLTKGVMSGYSVGEEHEGLFIDAWESEAEKNPKKLSVYLLEQLASPKQKSRLLGKIFPEGEKNISENESLETDEEYSPTQALSDEMESSRIDKARIKENKADSKPESDLFSELSQGDDADEIKEVRALILSENEWTKRVKAARRGLALDMGLRDVNRLLASGLPEEFSSYSLYPRLGYTLHSLKHGNESRKHAHIKLSMLWSALHEDIQGIAMSEVSEKYKEIKGFYKNILLKKYSFNQALWTLRNAVLTNTSTAEFVSVNWRHLLTVIEQNSRTYHAVKETQKEDERGEEIQEERLKRLKKIREEDSPGEVKHPLARLYLSKKKETNER